MCNEKLSARISPTADKDMNSWDNGRPHCDDDGVCHRHGNGRMCLPFRGGIVKETGRMNAPICTEKSAHHLERDQWPVLRGGFLGRVKWLGLLLLKGTVRTNGHIRLFLCLSLFWLIIFLFRSTFRKAIFHSNKYHHKDPQVYAKRRPKSNSRSIDNLSMKQHNSFTFWYDFKML